MGQWRGGAGRGGRRAGQAGGRRLRNRLRGYRASAGDRGKSRVVAMLVATNIFGQNTPAIGVTETHYMEMWAQDAAAMYAYAGSSSSASQLTAFTEPPQHQHRGHRCTIGAVSQSSTSTGLNIGTQLSQLINSVPNTLQSLATTTRPHPRPGRCCRCRHCRRDWPPTSRTGTPSCRRPSGPTRRSSGRVACLAVRSCRSGRRSPTPRTGRVSRPCVRESHQRCAGAHCR